MYHSKTLLVKQGTFLYEVWPDLAEKRDILITGNLDKVEFYIGNLIIGELFITSESRPLHFSNSGIFVDGRNREKRIGNLKIN